MPASDNDIKIAVLEEQIRGLREQQKAHAESSAAQFETLFEKIDVLTAALNRGKGMYAASLMFFGAVGAVLEWVFWGRK
jgi:hypothetical protein